MRGLLPDAEIETRVLALLATEPMRQTDIFDAFPISSYYDAMRILRAMEARGLITREKCGRTKLVRLATRA